MANNEQHEVIEKGDRAMRYQLICQMWQEMYLMERSMGPLIYNDPNSRRPYEWTRLTLLRVIQAGEAALLDAGDNVQGPYEAFNSMSNTIWEWRQDMWFLYTFASKRFK